MQCFSRRGLINGILYLLIHCHRLKKKNANMFAADYDGRTALHQACQAGQLGAVRFLVALKNVDVNVKDHDGFTPMADAVYNGHLEVATLMKDNGGVLSLQDGALCIVRHIYLVCLLYPG